MCVCVCVCIDGLGEECVCVWYGVGWGVGGTRGVSSQSVCDRETDFSSLIMDFCLVCLLYECGKFREVFDVLFTCF